MFQARYIEGQTDWLDDTNSKIYTISTHNKPVDQSKYFSRLQQVKLARNIDWTNIPSFVIFHDGATCDYLVLVWWGNDNELFTSVSVKLKDTWIEDSNKYSFCLYDLEIMWAERNVYIKTMDCQSPSLTQYIMTR